MNAVLAAALLVAVAAAPALAQQQQYPSDTPPPARSQDQMDQQAQTPQEERSRPGDIESLKQDHMTSPNVTGESVPESTETGLPEPGASSEQLRRESVPRP